MDTCPFGALLSSKDGLLMSIPNRQLDEFPQKENLKLTKNIHFIKWFINMKINLVHILLLEVSEIDGKIAKAIIERKIISEHSS